jgi:hypothetical protein
MRDCPKCSKPVDGFSCAACGWRDATYRTARADHREKLPCVTCGRPGVFAIDGHTPPWFCYRHYPTVPMPNHIRERLRAMGLVALAITLDQRTRLTEAELEAIAERAAIQTEQQP